MILTFPITRLTRTWPGYTPDLTNRWLQQHGRAIVTLQSRNDAAKSKVCEHSFASLRGSGCHLWRRILGAFIRVGILIVFLTVLFTLLGPPFGILLTKTMEARRVPAVKVAPRELADYSISNSSGTTLAYFGYKFDVPWKANFKQKAVGKNLVEVQFELGQDLVFIVPENQQIGRAHV